MILHNKMNENKNMDILVDIFIYFIPDTPSISEQIKETQTFNNIINLIYNLSVNDKEKIKVKCHNNTVARFSEM